MIVRALTHPFDRSIKFPYLEQSLVLLILKDCSLVFFIILCRGLHKRESCPLEASWLLFKFKVIGLGKSDSEECLEESEQFF